MSIIRTRFAPSPTGYLHVGGARTALFSYLFARKQGGQFILRIEDTDRERSTPESVQAILDAMSWLNLDYDEGPFYQTQRFDRYALVLAEMLTAGSAYRCYCTKERLEALREAQMKRKEKPRYDGHCRHLSPEKKHEFEGLPSVIRFKNPHSGEVVFDDLIRGRLTFANAELDDLIIARSDGTPTYNFTVVVDDWDMKITHVIRGDDHINNTPRQINILKALGANIPYYAHVPMILGSDSKRLSKRHGAVSVMQYREEGYLPHALLNYLARLGWSHGDQEIFSREELIEHFKLKNISRSPAAFNQEKLLWLNHHYIKTADPNDLIADLSWQLDHLSISTTDGPDLVPLILAQAERCKTMKEMAERSRFFFEAVTVDPKAIEALDGAVKEGLQRLYQAFHELSGWEKEAIHETLVKVAESAGLKLGKLAQPLRIAVSGGTVSPPIDITLVLLGKAKTMQRLAAFISAF